MIPFVTLELDKTYHLRFGMGASVEFEQLTKVKLTSLDEDNLSIELCAKILWIMLKREDKTITFEKTLELVDEYAENMGDIINKVTEAIKVSYEIKNAQQSGNQNINS